jgi:hypothetical protein
MAVNQVILALKIPNRPAQVIQFGFQLRDHRFEPGQLHPLQGFHSLHQSGQKAGQYFDWREFGTAGHWRKSTIFAFCSLRICHERELFGWTCNAGGEGRKTLPRFALGGLSV